MEEHKFDLDKIIEKYRFWIGGILVLAIVGGSAVLIWRENYSKPKVEDRISALEGKINQLESEVKEYQVSSIKYQVGEQASQQSVPEQGQVAGVSSQNANTPPQPHPTSPSKGEEISGKINLNTATLAELDSLVGIGPTYAQRIIDYRNEKGGFKSTDEVKNVKGIGEKTFEKFKDQISI